jgi:hypothetical protein
LVEVWQADKFRGSKATTDPNTFIPAGQKSWTAKLRQTMCHAIVPENATFQPRPLRKGEFTRKEEKWWLTSKELA